MVIFDTDCGVHVPALTNAVRAAVLQKYRSSTFVPKCSDEGQNTNEVSTDMIETEITVNLSRIHLCRPTDNFDVMCAFEALRDALENERQDVGGHC